MLDVFVTSTFLSLPSSVRQTSFNQCSKHQRYIANLVIYHNIFKLMIISTQNIMIFLCWYYGDIFENIAIFLIISWYFKNTKMNIFVFLLSLPLFSLYFPIFSPMLPISCFSDPQWYIRKHDVCNIDSNTKAENSTK